MNWDQTKGRGGQRELSKKQWHRLTDDNLTVIAGQRDQLVAKIQERYGIARGSQRASEYVVAMKVNVREDVRSEGAAQNQLNTSAGFIPTKSRGRLSHLQFWTAHYGAFRYARSLGLLILQAG